MATANTLFTFDALAENWSYTAATSDEAASGYDGTEQALKSNIFGRNKVTTASYWEWSGTWEDLGVTAGDEVSEVVFDYDYRCYIANVSDGWTVGAAQVLNSAGDTIIGTISTGTAGSGTSGTYTTKTGTAVTIGATYKASTTTIRLRILVGLDNANNSSAETGTYYDNIDVTVTHDTAAATRRIFNIG